MLLAAVTATHSEPARKSQIASKGAERVWCAGAGQDQIWCILSEMSQRALLEHVLSGPGASTPTAVERTIVAECVDRLLSSPGCKAWNEIGTSPPPGELWCCSVDIGGSNGKIASLLLAAIAQAEPVASTHVCLDDVPIDLVARIEDIVVPLHEVAGWAEGSVLPLGRPATDLRAVLASNHGPLLVSRVGTSKGKRSIRVVGVRP